MTDKSANVRQFTVQADDNDIRLDRWFKRHLPDIGFATISRWARTGQIRVDGKRADPADHVMAGQILRVPPGGLVAKGPRAARTRAPLTAEQRELADSMLLHTTPSALVLNKPPGLATQGGSGTFQHVDGLLDAFAAEGAPRPKLVHRLDKDTSGVLLVARSANAAAWFSKRFSGRNARKVYWALVAGVPQDEGTIDLPLAKQPGTGGEKMMVDHSELGQPSRTLYRVIDRAGNSACWVELQPFTGRTHQLRVHMAAIGHPIIGDGKYGGPDAFLSGSISRKMHLHARRLVIDLPEGGALDVTAPLPEHFAASLAQLGFVESEGYSPLAPPPEPTKAELKTAAKAHAKQYRKERRGERRKRADGGDATTRKPTGQRAGKPAGKSGAKSAGKPAARKPGARPAAKPGPRKPKGTA